MIQIGQKKYKAWLFLGKTSQSELVSLHNFALQMVKHLGAISNSFEHFQIFHINWSLFLALQLLAFSYTLFLVQFIRNCNRITNFWVRHFGKIDQFWFDDFFVKKATKSKNCVLTKKTFCSIFPVLINLDMYYTSF